ncbi:hypothetical protein GR160_04240 [Flavobacterium sp. Sd200]|uniref:hypothetical protein n=1 Tax=Flavobacterium sp. Sd200 TaxID=2692211 RepID=UPI00136B0CAA|nr:hypothetical protein [Flavobacterium sp. Sd200]MXN90427.1 hypothetical protein [Flavobacterium sp. Sd200]
MIKIVYIFLLTASLSLYAQDNETISWDEASISNKLPLTISKQEFDRIYKKADSIVTPNYVDICGTDADSNFQYVYYKGVQYEMDNKILNFRKIVLAKNPKNNMFFVHKGLKFNGTTKITEMQQLFPRSFENTEDSEDKIYKIVKLKPAEIGEDYEWLFFFKNGLLAAIECKFPC